MPTYRPCVVLSPALGLAAALLPACVITSTGVGVTYDLAPQEFSTDLGSQTGTLPSVSCSASPAVCDQLPVQPPFVASCDAATQQCVATGDVRVVEPVDLATQQGFPTSVVSATSILSVTVNSIKYWTPANTFDIATPPFDLYVGPAAAQTETDPGTTQLGTIPAIPAGTLTACASGPAGTLASACTMAITSSGMSALATFAKSYASPFNVIVVAHLTLHGGDPLPAGSLTLDVRPEIVFGIGG